MGYVARNCVEGHHYGEIQTANQENLQDCIVDDWLYCYFALLIKYITHNTTYHPPLYVYICLYIYNILYITPPHLEEHVYT